MNSADENRLQLIRNEIGLSFTLIESARIAYNIGHTEHGNSAYSHAETAYQGALRFLGDRRGDKQTDSLQSELIRLRGALDDFRASLTKT